MSSRERRPAGWRTEAEAAAASGGHIGRETPADPLFDPLTPPLAAERYAGGVETGERHGAFGPGEERDREAERSAPRPPMRRRRAVARRVRRTIKHVDPLSVLKLSLFFYAVLLIVWLIIVAILYALINSIGLFDLIENFGEGMAVTSLQDLDITLWLVERWALLFGILFVVVASVVNVFLAILYNVGADVLGGVEVTFVERDF